VRRRGRHSAAPPYRRRRWLLGGATTVVVALVVVLVVVLLPSTGRSKPVSRRVRARTAASRLPATFLGPDGVEARWVIEQNELPGTTAWRITTPQQPDAIMGYASRVQARLGQRVTLYVSTVAPEFKVEAFRMGYYQGKGGRLVWQSKELPGTVQPSCPVTPGIYMVQCDWSPSLTFTVTKAFVQGQYLLKLVGSGGQQSYVPLTIWDPSSHATYVLMAGVLTWQVFNPFGGYDLYEGQPPGLKGYPYPTRSRVVSFDRPYATSYGNGAASFLGNEYPLIYYAEEHGLDVTYWTDITLAEHGNLLANHTVLISPGHDEEWSLRMRNAVLAARAKGVNLIFFGASPILRKVRLQASPLGPDMEVVNYRDPTADPLYGKDDAEVTQNWWGQPPADAPASQIVGDSYVGFNNVQSFPLVVSDASSWLFAGTGLHDGSTVPGVLFTDFDQYVPSRPNPPDVEILAHSPVIIQFDGAHLDADTEYYTWRPSGAGVFESGTNNWINALQTCSSPSDCPAPLVQKMTGNLLRVFGQGPVGKRYPSVGNVAQFYPGA
jgi:hypothetical protein